MEPEERLFLGLKILERIRPQLRELRQGWLPVREKSGFNESFNLPSLAALLDSAGALPDYSAVLGACEDGLPFILDLSNPAPGALLVAADPGGGKSRLIRAFLGSVNRLNPPEQVQYQLLAANPEEYGDLELDPHCVEVRSLHNSPADPVANLVEITHRRRYEGEAGPIIIFVIDDLASCLPHLDAESISQFVWLARHGARSGVWVMATLRPDDLGELDDRILGSFRTSLLGPVSSAGIARRLAGNREAPRSQHSLDGEFCVPFGDSWVHFWICDDESDSSEQAGEEV